MLNNAEQLLCFAAVCKTGSITHAALLLQCSKANVSKKIHAFEHRLKTTLLQRTTRKIYLTEAGQKLKPQALELLEQCLLAEHGARIKDDQLTGDFRITAPVSIATFLLAPLLLKLKHQFPKINFELDATNESLPLLERGIDLAIRSGSAVDDSLVARRLGEFHDGFFTSSINAAHWSKLPFNALAEATVVLNQDSSEGDELNVFHRSKMLKIAFPNNLKIREYQVTLNMLYGSSLVAWLPSYCAGLHNGNEVITRLYPNLRSQPWPVYLIFPFQTPLPAKLCAVADFIQQALTPYFAEEDKLEQYGNN